MIPQEKKQQIRQKAKRQARKAFRPDIRAARKDLQRTKKQKARDLSGVERSSDYLRNALDQAMGNVDPRLKGGNLQTVLGELTAMKGDAAKMVPLEQSAIRQSYASPLASARDNLTNTRMARTEAAQKAYADRITAIKTPGEAQQARHDDRVAIRDETKLAIKVATDNLKLGVDPSAPVSDAAKKAGVPVTENDWIVFERSLAGEEDIGRLAARRAVAELRRRAGIGGAVMGVAGAAMGVPRKPTG